VFFPGSRYSSMIPYTVTLADGSTVRATRLPAPGIQAVLGYYRRKQGDRLDQLAGRFLADATEFWHLCDANGSMAPDALAARDLVGVPIDAQPVS
jgi:hypothetical protein